MENYTLKSCLHCNQTIPKTRVVGWPKYQQKQFCSHRCRGEHAKLPANPNRHCLGCEKPITRRPGEPYYNFCQRVYCDKKCVATHKRSQLFDENGNKRCSCCGEWKPEGGYTPSARYNGTCKACCAVKSTRYKDRWKSKFQRRTEKNDIKHNLRTLRSSAKARALSSGLPFDITLDYLMQLWEGQGGRCFYTGLPMTNLHDEDRNLYRQTNVSIDRIEPAKGYTVGNVALCRFSINLFKSDLALDQFLSYAALLTERAEDIRTGVEALQKRSE